MNKKFNRECFFLGIIVETQRVVRIVLSIRLSDLKSTSFLVLSMRFTYH